MGDKLAAPVTMGDKLAAPVLGESDWGSRLDFLEPLVPENKRTEMAAVLKDQDSDRLLTEIDLRGVSVEVIAWVKADKTAEFILTDECPRALWVLFHPTGNQIPPHLKMLEEHRMSSAFEEAVVLGKYLVHHAFVTSEQLVGAHGYFSLVEQLSNSSRVKFDLLWRKFLQSREKKKAALKREASSPKKETADVASKAKGEGAKVEKDVPVAVRTVFLRPKDSSIAGKDIRGILETKALGTLVAGDGERYKVKTTCLHKMKEEFAELADFEDQDEAASASVKTFAQERAREEADAETRSLDPREYLEAMRMTSKFNNPVLQSLAKGLDFSNGRLQKIIARGDQHREEKKRKRHEVLNEVKEEDLDDEFLAAPVL